MARSRPSGPADTVTLVGAGVTLHESLAAAELLAGEGIAARVIDCYSIKPIDTTTLAASCGDGRAPRRRRGPLPLRDGEAVLLGLVVAGTAPLCVHLAVRVLSQSGTSAELLVAASHIAKAVRLFRSSATERRRGPAARTDDVDVPAR